ncbi:unnamed protein product [Brachionus calyciflorus]|uniref:Uncharacterized protein n=1 Tax=Brachionus calyciflorus TaxID=104777 RepID=A0A813Y4B5_9BILA|nr:unnamed protein product [Brachionus calyciflorus]
MGNILGTTRITNNSNQTVQICLIDTNGKITDQKLEQNSHTNIETPKGRNTIKIVSPIDNPYFQQCYTVCVNWPLVICEENGLLTIKRAKVTIERHTKNHGGYGNMAMVNTETKRVFDYDLPNIDHSDLQHRIYNSSNIEDNCTHVYNSTNDLIRIQLTDSDNRNTTQYVVSNDSVLITSPKGQNTVQIINEIGKVCATYTINATVYLGPSMYEFLLIIDTKKGYDFRKAKWMDKDSKTYNKKFYII